MLEGLTVREQYKLAYRYERIRNSDTLDFKQRNKLCAKIPALRVWIAQKAARSYFLANYR